METEATQETEAGQSDEPATISTRIRGLEAAANAGSADHVALSVVAAPRAGSALDSYVAPTPGLRWRLASSSAGGGANGGVDGGAAGGAVGGAVGGAAGGAAATDGKRTPPLLPDAKTPLEPEALERLLQSQGPEGLQATLQQFLDDDNPRWGAGADCRLLCCSQSLWNAYELTANLPPPTPPGWTSSSARSTAPPSRLAAWTCCRGGCTALCRGRRPPTTSRRRWQSSSTGWGRPTT
jgi:hypothetical protein